MNLTKMINNFLIGSGWGIRLNYCCFDVGTNRFWLASSKPQFESGMDLNPSRLGVY